ncbi:MaoC/PaaZ C-terminal domain-containing protein [Amycolatopsis benzoatilytica]|uniref:MaoC/PaaZ C-terminal domain-containing protein n=1 Tax=Amycolatopsis benzoatilytica TaxID=346045 RepID=UPI0004822843|nr:MaoC/PaaZ C-terminal domain-containing protein [Amycolatopsis benzoatilytica]
MAEAVVGERLPERSFPLTRADLVRYAGASGDLNPIHWSDREAREAGLPGVIAHGMLTFGLAVRAVTDWAGGAAFVTGCRARFRRPVVVPDGGAVTVTVGGVVTGRAEDGTVTVELEATCDGEKVLAAAKVQVHFAR